VLKIQQLFSGSHKSKASQLLHLFSLPVSLSLSLTLILFASLKEVRVYFTKHLDSDQREETKPQTPPNYLDLSPAGFTQASNPAPRGQVLIGQSLPGGPILPAWIGRAMDGAGQ
jgi:hypothetical protein